MRRHFFRFGMAAGLLMLTLASLTLVAQETLQSRAISYAGGDGSTIRKAIVIRGARSAAEGLAAEGEWIRLNLPGASLQSQGRVTGPPHYDVVTVRLASGALMDLHFDITDFFGR